MAKRLEAMHDAGYAHHDLKPANVMWLPRENQWTLIDFGCASPLGRRALLRFTLAYAAPEVIKVWRTGEKQCVSTPAVDAWALGVMVYELLTGKAAFDVFLQGRDAVRLRHHTLILQKPCAAIFVALPWIYSQTCTLEVGVGLQV